MNQRGFLTLGLQGYLAAGAAAIIIVLCVATWALGNRLDSEREAHAVTRGQFKVFQDGVEAAGKAQQAKNAALLKEREKLNADRLMALQTRYADIAARYDRMRGKPADTRPGGVPAIPDTAPLADAAARDNRLLDVLQHAEKQTGQLIELQEWARQQR